MTLITGTKKADVLAGGSRDDILIGGKGNDVLIGGGGADAMRGGKGADTFVVAYGDHILDFKQGVDKLVVAQPYERLYQDDTGLYAEFAGVPVGQPADLIVKADGVSWFGFDIINA